MITFFDQHGNKVELVFSKHYCSDEAQHVFVICQFGDKWLLTNHKLRGLEFPGGKREPGETLEEAARREVYEETGAIITELQHIAHYRVFDEGGTFVKAVFWGKADSLETTTSYFETNGPVLIEGNLLQKRFGDDYSFIMKDKVVAECLGYLQDKK
ncbi:RNA deprotection pyrophosphohydrolase [Bacillus rubiinfantis]|uniref:RNA deprotection pyrophosphohydrolase n=1 Tax=Bacillus rubiinfantis TaxID=1499680 RepID=UPI0005A7B3D4|nr:nucleoside triphosphatase YtkD [Bacillus rubiinfantis]